MTLSLTTHTYIYSMVPSICQKQEPSYARGTYN